jgi:hypothetical protein
MTHTLLGTATAGASTNSLAITLTAGAAIGSTVLIGCCWESSTGVVPTISSVVDSRGNTYSTTPDVSVDAGTTLAVMILRGKVTTALLAGDTITVTVSGGARTRWCLQADAFDDLTATPLDQTASNAPGSSASLSTGTTAATTQANEQLYAVFGFGSGRTTTIPSGWSGTAKVETSAGISDRGMQVIYKTVTATGTQQGTLTLSSASTYGGIIGTYKNTVAPAPPVARVSQTAFETPLPSAAKLARVSQVALEVPQGVTGEVRVSQVRLTVPSKAGQPPYSGIKAARGGALWDATISSATGGTV